MEEVLLKPLAKENSLSSPTSRASLDPDPTLPAQRNSYEVLGKQGAIFMSFGSATILATLGFFVFLWYSDESNAFWKRIMLGDWAVRSVTITAVLTRWVVVTQATFATAMLAGLILQQPKVAFSDSAPISLMMVSNSGPWDLSLPLSRTRSRSTRVDFYGLALFLTLSTTLLQFTSTILLSDFTITPIESQPQDMPVNYGWDWPSPRFSSSSQANSMRYGNLWQARPASYPPFAEYIDAAPFITDGVDDSGVIIRAFFPPDSAPDLSSLGSFRGVTSVLGMRIICAAPQYYELNLTVTFPGLDIDISSLSTNVTASGLGTFGQDTRDWWMSCSLPLIQLASNFSSEWALSLCHAPDLWSGDGTSIPINSGDSYYTFGGGYLLFNVTGDADSWAGSTTANRWKQSTHGAWAKFVSEDMSSQLDITACTTAFRQEHLNISSSRKSNRTEPLIGWDTVGKKFDTLDIRQQLQATEDKLSEEDRGIFSLEILQKNHTSDGLSAFQQTWEVPFMGSNSSLALCQYCTWYGDRHSDAAQSAIFQDILQQTSQPAMALQAYWTIIYSMYYYVQAGQFDLGAPATITTFVLRFQPSTHRGFIVYSIIIMVHLVLILFITSLFLASKRQTLLSNSWQAITQIVSMETAPILEFADRATDSEFSEWIKKRGKDGSSFGITEGESGMRLPRCSD